MFLPSLNVVLVSGMWKMSVLYEDCSNVRVFGGRQGKSASDGLHQILKDEIFFLCSPFIPADILCLRCEYFTCITSPYLRDRNILWKIFSSLSILNHCLYRKEIHKMWCTVGATNAEKNTKMNTRIWKGKNNLLNTRSANDKWWN